MQLSKRLASRNQVAIWLLIGSMLFQYGNSVEGSLILSIENVEMQPSSRNHVDVIIGNDSVVAISLGLANYEFSITRLSGPASSTLSFISPQVDEVDETLLPSYVFFQHSAGIADDGTNAQTYLASDATIDHSTVLLGTDEGANQVNNRLLVRLELKHEFVPPPDVGSFVDTVFEIALVKTGTYFGDPLGGSFVTLPPTPVTGTVTVRATAVPEPNSIAILAIVGISTCVWRNRSNQELIASQ